MKKIATIILSLISLIIFSQENEVLLINTNIVKSTLLNHSKPFVIHKISYEEVDYPIFNENGNKTEKVKIHMLKEVNTNPNKINGRFILSDDKFKISTKEIPGYYIKHELIPYEEINSNFENKYSDFLSSKTYLIIKNINSNIHYAINEKDYFFTLGIKSINRNLKDRFTFVNSTAKKIEKNSLLKKEGYFTQTPILRKRISGIFEIDSIYKNIDYNNLKYKKLNTIHTNKEFICLSNLDDYSNSMEKNVIIQDWKSKQLYLIIRFSFVYQNTKNMNNIKEANGYLLRYKPIELTNTQKKVLQSYKSYINKANIKTNRLVAIQKKHLNIFGYFLPNEVSNNDRIIYNKTLKELKKIAEKIDVLNDEKDSDFIVRDKLSMKEIGTLSAVHNWNTYQIEI